MKAVRRALEKLGVKGTVFGGDADSRCIGQYFVDRFWHMPPLSELSPEALISYCLRHSIRCVIPTRDGELPFFARQREAFLQEGISLMISGGEQVSTCLDKCRFYHRLSAWGYPAIKTAEVLDELQCQSYVVKERYGAGGRHIGLNLSKAAALDHAKGLQHPVFQPWIEGEEMSVDLYLDLSGRAKGVIARHREVVVDGESQVTVSKRNEKLESMCKEIAEALELYGHVLFQCIQDRRDRHLHLLECNPRFGGASSLSLAMGLDSFYWFFLEAMGEDLSRYPFIRPQEEKRLVRFKEDFIF